MQRLQNLIIQLWSMQRLQNLIIQPCSDCHYQIDITKNPPVLALCKDYRTLLYNLALCKYYKTLSYNLALCKDYKTLLYNLALGKDDKTLLYNLALCKNDNDTLKSCVWRRKNYISGFSAKVTCCAFLPHQKKNTGVIIRCNTF